MVIVTHIWQNLSNFERAVALIVIYFWQLFSHIFGETLLIVRNIWRNRTRFLLCFPKMDGIMPHVAEALLNGEVGFLHELLRLKLEEIIRVHKVLGNGEYSIGLEHTLQFGKRTTSVWDLRK